MRILCENCVYFTCQYEVSSGSVAFWWEDKVLEGLPHLRMGESQHVVSGVAMRRTNQAADKDPQG